METTVGTILRCKQMERVKELYLSLTMFDVR